MEDPWKGWRPLTSREAAESPECLRALAMRIERERENAKRAGAQRPFFEVEINGRTYARFDKREHAETFAAAVRSDGTSVVVVPVHRARL